MLERSDRPIEEVIRFLAKDGIEAGFLVPTSTGLGKSIMDAHQHLRAYLKVTGAHDYDLQQQGQTAKVTRRAWLLGPDSSRESIASLYRPESKSGDPRIWFTGLPGYAVPGNLLAIFAHEGELYVANTSMPGVLESGTSPDSPLGHLLSRIAANANEPAAELLCKLKEISALGFVPSLRQGPTGVGMTLETMLGIAANSSKAPDYRGIEIKASRTKQGPTRQNRITLFSKVPDWKLSAVKDATSLLRRYGYEREGRTQLYCSMGDKPNTLGLFLDVREEDLHALHSQPAKHSEVLQWSLEGLRNTLAEKHQQTFWVKAVCRKNGSGEELFHYTEAMRTRAPLVSNLDSLLALGKVEVDLLLHLMERGQGKAPKARDHGYLFKINPRDIGMLFPPSVIYGLS
ncbi:hypothetical protein ABIE51_002472 [Lysobacter sp. OAE881]